MRMDKRDSEGRGGNDAHEAKIECPPELYTARVLAVLFGLLYLSLLLFLLYDLSLARLIYAAILVLVPGGVKHLAPLVRKERRRSDFDSPLATTLVGVLFVIGVANLCFEPYGALIFAVLFGFVLLKPPTSMPGVLRVLRNGVERCRQGAFFLVERPAMSAGLLAAPLLCAAFRHSPLLLYFLAGEEAAIGCASDEWPYVAAIGLIVLGGPLLLFLRRRGLHERTISSPLFLIFSCASFIALECIALTLHSSILRQVFHEVSVGMILWIAFGLCLALGPILRSVAKAWPPVRERLDELQGALNAGINRHADSYWILPLFAGLSLLWSLPLFILGEDSFVLIHDNLDSYLPLFRRMAESGLLFSSSSTPFPSLLGGMPRGFLFSGYYFPAILHLYFPAFYAYAIDRTIVHLIAFLGMFRLLHYGYLRFRLSALLSALVATCFGMLPFFPYTGLSVAGLPLVLASLIAIQEHGWSLKDTLILVLFPFYSCVVHVGAFFLFCLCLYLLYDAFCQKHLNVRLFIGIAILVCGHLIVEHLLVEQFLSADFPASHRSTWNSLLLGVNEPSSWEVFWENLTRGHYHSTAFQSPVIFIALILAVIASPGWMLKQPVIRLAALAILAFSAVYGLWHYLSYHAEWWHALNLDKLTIGFNFGRFFWLAPVAWHLLFALALYAIIQSAPFGWGFVIVLCFLKAMPLFAYSDYDVERAQSGYTFKQFYSPQLFSDVRRDIGKPVDSYRVLSIGIHPAIAFYNGFSTVDGYYPNYPLSTKLAFRRIIAAELEKTPAAKRYFDGWGSRAYAFVAELEPDRSHTAHRQPPVIKAPQLDMNAFYELGGRYVFSSVYIEDAETIGLRLLKSYSSPESPYRIRVYEVSRVPPPATRL